MTPAEARLFRRTQRYAAALRPDMAAAVLASFQRIRDALGDTALTRAIEFGQSDQIFAEILTLAVVVRAFLPVREQLRRVTSVGFSSTTPDIPRLASNRVGIAFDVLNPRVLDAVRAMEVRVMTTLEQSVREVVRQRVEHGLIAGQSPRAIATTLRDVVGLAPNQAQAVRHYEQALREGTSVARYTLRDQRLAQSGDLTEAQIMRATEAYRTKMRAFNAETNARTATLNAFKLGQHLAWQDAIDHGVVAADRVRRLWVGIMDTRERPEHVAMEGDMTTMDQPFSNGDMIPGESTFGCRCVSRYSLVA